jgi:hypothetical protein
MLPALILAARRDRNVIHRFHCLRSNSCKARAACSQELQQGSGFRIVGIAQALDPFLHDVDVSQLTQLTEESLACSLHLFPCGMGVHGPKAVRHGAATAQGHAQVMNRLRGEVQAGTVAFLQHPFHPQSEPRFLAPVPSRGSSDRQRHVHFRGCGIINRSDMGAGQIPAPIVFGFSHIFNVL